MNMVYTHNFIIMWIWFAVISSAIYQHATTDIICI